MLGGISHPILDSLMHDDISPLLPFSTANPFAGILPYPALAASLLVAAVIGAVALAFQWRDLGERMARDRQR